MNGVHEELGTAAVRSASVSHRQTSRLVRDFADVFVLDVSTIETFFGATGLQVLEGRA